MRVIQKSHPPVLGLVLTALLAMGMFVLASNVSTSPDTRSSFEVPELPAPAMTVAPSLLDLDLPGVHFR